MNSAILNDYLSIPITWERTGNVHYPWQTKVNGKHLVLRLGDFPAEACYTLLVDDKEIGEVNGWPQDWKRATD